MPTYQPALLYGKEENRLTVIEALGIPFGAADSLNDAPNTGRYLFFNTTSGTVKAWNGSAWINIAVGFDIVNIGSGSPDPLQPNTIQVKSTGEVFFVDKDGDVQQIEFVPVTQIKMNKLLAADGTNTISNAAFTQEWQWVLTTGGKGLRLNNTRVGTTGTTDEVLFELITGGNDQAPRHVKTLRIQNSGRIPPNKSVGSVTGLEIILDGTVGGTGQSNLNNALKIISNFRGIDVDSQETALILKGLIGALSAQGASTFLPYTSLTDQTTMTVRRGAGANAKALEINAVENATPDALGIWVNPAGGVNICSSFMTVNAANKKAIVSIGAGTADRASLNIEEALVDQTTPVDGNIWRRNNHLYVRLNGVTYQLDQQAVGGADESIYAGDGTLTGLRTVNMNNFSLIFDNSGLFRIRDTGSDTGIYDFFEGIDFLVANAVKSYSITKDLTNGIKLTSIDNIGTTNDKKEIIIDNTQIKIDSEVFLLANIPNLADNAAAIAAGLANDSIYRDNHGFIRSKQASVLPSHLLVRQDEVLPAGDSIVNVSDEGDCIVYVLAIKSDTNSPGVQIGFTAGTGGIMPATDLTANQWEVVTVPFVIEAATNIHISDIVGNGALRIFKLKLS